MDAVEVTTASLRRVLVLAEELRRSNLSKLSFDEQAWNAAVAAFGTVPESLLPADARANDLVRRARKIARRLGDAGEARFGSYSVGRAPDSSRDGKRFHRDLAAAQEVLEQLETIRGAARSRAGDGDVPRR